MPAAPADRPFKLKEFHMAGVLKHAGPVAGGGSRAGDPHPIFNHILDGLRALLWTLPPEHHPSEFWTHGGRLR